MDILQKLSLGFLSILLIVCLDNKTTLAVCPTIVIPDGSANSTVTDVDEVVSFTCEGGFEFIGDNPVFCLDDGTWSGNYSCVAIDCGTFSAANADVSFDDGTLSGSIATITCKSGYEFNSAFPDDPVTSVCQDDRTWTSEDGCVIKDCGTIPPVSPDGFVTFDTGSAVTTFGSELLYQCNAGYRPENTTISCDSTGTWSSGHTCIVVDCGAVSTTLANGAVTVGGTTFSQQVTYTCLYGYRLTGSDVITCEASGSWSDNPPTCVFIDCGGLSSTLVNGLVSNGGSALGDTVNYTCSSGYAVVGSDVLTCQENGNWTGSPPTCEVVNEVRILAYARTSLDCDDYTEAELEELLRAAQQDMPSVVLTLLPEDNTTDQTVQIIGLSCNSPLRYLIEVVVSGTENLTKAETEVQVALEDIVTITTQLVVNGQNITLTFNNVTSSSNTDASCEAGEFTDVTTLQCTPCRQNTYQPTGVMELCLPCPASRVTTGTGVYGSVEDVCISDSAHVTLGLTIGIPLSALFIISIILAALYCAAKLNKPALPKYPPQRPAEFVRRAPEERSYRSRQFPYAYNTSYFRHYPNNW